METLHFAIVRVSHKTDGAVEWCALVMVEHTSAWDRPARFEWQGIYPTLASLERGLAKVYPGSELGKGRGLTFMVHVTRHDTDTTDRIQRYLLPPPDGREVEVPSHGNDAEITIQSWLLDEVVQRKALAFDAARNAE